MAKRKSKKSIAQFDVDGEDGHGNVARQGRQLRPRNGLNYSESGKTLSHARDTSDNDPSPSQKSRKISKTKDKNEIDNDDGIDATEGLESDNDSDSAKEDGGTSTSESVEMKLESVSDVNMDDFPDLESWDNKSQTSEGQSSSTKSRRQAKKASKSWGATSRELRNTHPPASRAASADKDWDEITLRHDPDLKHTGEDIPVTGRILRMVARGCLWVVLPSLNKQRMELERAVLIRGLDYTSEKQRFKDNGGDSVVSSTHTALLDTSYTDFHMNSVATTRDNSMVLIEGFIKNNKNGQGGQTMVLSFTTFARAYGMRVANTYVTECRKRVGQDAIPPRQLRRIESPEVSAYLTGMKY